MCVCVRFLSFPLERFLTHRDPMGNIHECSHGSRLNFRLLAFLRFSTAAWEFSSYVRGQKYVMMHTTCFLFSSEGLDKEDSTPKLRLPSSRSHKLSIWPPYGAILISPRRSRLSRACARARTHTHTLTHTHIHKLPLPPGVFPLLISTFPVHSTSFPPNQPWYNPLWLTVLKIPTNYLSALFSLR